MKNRLVPALAAPFLGLALAGFAVQSNAATTYFEGFNGTALPAGWTATNLSTAAAGGGAWTDGVGITDASGNIQVAPQEGNGFAIVNYTSIASGTGTINNWLISPEYFKIQNGDTFSFYTTTVAASSYPDRLEFRLSSGGASLDVGATTTSVGSFTNLLTSVNPTLALGGYPESFTKISVTVSGLAAPIDGRVGFRYYVTDAGPSGSNSNVIGVDSFTYVSTAAVPEPETWALMIGGLGALGWLGKRRASRQG